MDGHNMDMGKWLALNTLRITTEISTGTGFLFSYDIAGSFIPVLVTNKHVLFNSKTMTLVIPYIESESQGVVNNIQFTVKNLEEAVIFHPNENIDLAIVPIAELLNQVVNEINTTPQVTIIDEELIPSENDLKNIKTIEDILVVGYPDGIWDDANNRPIVRRGITATDYKVDFKGEPKFIVDCSIFPSSSGSPVFLASEGVVSDGLGGYTFYGTPQVKLLGINSAVYIHNANGMIVETDVNLLTGIPNGLGIIIKSRELFAFRDVLKCSLS